MLFLSTHHINRPRLLGYSAPVSSNSPSQYPGSTTTQLSPSYPTQTALPPHPVPHLLHHPRRHRFHHPPHVRKLLSEAATSMGPSPHTRRVSVECPVKACSDRAAPGNSPRALSTCTPQTVLSLPSAHTSSRASPASARRGRHPAAPRAGFPSLLLSAPRLPPAGRSGSDGGSLIPLLSPRPLSRPCWVRPTC